MSDSETMPSAMTTSAPGLRRLRVGMALFFSKRLLTAQPSSATRGWVTPYSSAQEVRSSWEGVA